MILRSLDGIVHFLLEYPHESRRYDEDATPEENESSNTSLYF